MKELSEGQQKRIGEVQEIIMEAFALNNVKMAYAIAALFSTALALMKEMELSEKVVTETLMEMIKSYKELKK